ncbi:MAG: hypothetical protein A2007_02235 [Verrucomicrobia bacterium GWC2_42_7]|nr:MAG: hypothetical protein A2007_02235 [Verrucomicrobia bacterium GWC2_42_7]
MSQEIVAQLVRELKLLKIEGEKDVYIGDDTLGTLEGLSSKKESAALVQESACEKKIASPEAKTHISKTSTPVVTKSSAVIVKDPVQENIIVYDVPQLVQIPPPPQFEIPDGTKEERYNWLKNRILNCPVCKEHVRPGKKVVCGVGSLNAKIFFCGEAPGGDEEIIGEPFVGKAGQLLTKIINAMGLQRSDVYIGNIMNWRPEMETDVGNRPPTQQEMNFCLPYLKAQIAIVQPQVIVALGATAVHGLLGHDPKRRMADVRGQWTTFANTPLMITFHPSYLLRNNTNKAKRVVWEDMLKVMEFTKMPISEKQQNFFLEG